VLAHYGVARAQDLVREIYDGRFQPSTVAAMAAVVNTAADAGDETALHLIDSGARELSLAARSVCDHLALAHGPIVLAGGMFRAVPRLRQRVIAHLTGRWPDMRVCPLAIEPASGAVSLALAAASGTLVVPAYLDR
jgi:N-acetylglucosamine kinase-like BadF-type ATPase